MSGRCWSLLTLLTLAAGCDLPGRPRPSDRPVPEDQVVDFAALYARNCAGCHGADGRLGPAPPLNDPLFLAVVPDAVLRTVINDGRPGTPMPAFGRDQGGELTDAQVRALADGLKPRWGKPRSEGAEVPRYAVAAPGDRERGASVFDHACSGCHGDQGEGGDAAGAINDRAFLSLISDQALRRYAITGRPDLGMPSFDGTDGRGKDFQPMTSAEIDDLVALLARWRQSGQAGGP